MEYREAARYALLVSDLLLISGKMVFHMKEFIQEKEKLDPDDREEWENLVVRWASQMLTDEDRAAIDKWESSVPPASRARATLRVVENRLTGDTLTDEQKQSFMASRDVLVRRVTYYAEQDEPEQPLQ